MSTYERQALSFALAGVHVASLAGYSTAGPLEAVAEQARNDVVDVEAFRRAASELRWDGRANPDIPDGNWVLADGFRAFAHALAGDSATAADLGEGSIDYRDPDATPEGDAQMVDAAVAGLRYVASKLNVADIVATLVADGSDLTLALEAAELLDAPRVTDAGGGGVQRLPAPPPGAR